MASTDTIIAQIKTQLQNSSALSYVDDNLIFLGARDTINQFPAIVLEPLRVDESSERDVYQSVDLRIFFAVIGYVNIPDPSYQMVGDGSSIKGILDLENDIKKAISGDRTLGGNAIYTWIRTSTFDLDQFPVRSVGIEIEVLTRQTDTTR